MTDILFTNARLIDPSQNLDASGHLATTDGVISALGSGQINGKTAKAYRVIDCNGACLAPGLVDMRVQTADPGSEHLEDLATLLDAAAAGGITGLGCLPNTQHGVPGTHHRCTEPNCSIRLRPQAALGEVTRGSSGKSRSRAG